ncbi:MAG: type II toxin-antitoxin system RelE/ParE family toxin [Ruminococcus sp.]|nr:type II toxin-antitoxin system RelE/ParE family toxin [Ruminococcus sp.]
MKYTVVFTESAKKELKKLDRHVASLIIGWIEKNLQGCEDPRSKGKALTANHSGEWRYRIGDYRLICLIDDDKLVILALSVGHRRDIYGGKRNA